MHGRLSAVAQTILSANPRTSFDITHENWLRSAKLEMLHGSFAP
jgi:hypothetical protein